MASSRFSCTVARDAAGWESEHPNFADAAAFSELYVEQRPRILTYLHFHYGWDDATAEDIAQQVFMVLWKVSTTFCGPFVAFRAYLWRSVRFESLTRRHYWEHGPLSYDVGVDVDADEEASIGTLLAGGCNVERQVLARIDLQETMSALQRCSKTLQRTLWLSVQGYTHQEMMQQLGCSTRKTVDARLVKVRWQLRQQMRGQRQQHRQWNIHYVACQSCGTTERCYGGRGLCRVCYAQVRYQEKCVQPMEHGRWNKRYRACIQCETTERPHWALGLCRACYARVQRKSEKDIAISN